jgi:SAM-dependent methyltransferase
MIVLVPGAPKVSSVDIGYYSNERPEVAAMVPATARTILDVGCGHGALGVLLKQRVPGRTVYGIEYNPDAAAQARKVLDGVVVCDIATAVHSYPAEMFDCIVFADVLEHLVEPREAVAGLKPFLRPRGTIVCSIPNIRHYTAIIRIIRRGWSYDAYGLFDRTHLRFFSRGSACDLVQSAGFTIDEIRAHIVASRKARIANSLLLNALEEFVTQQYLIRATPNAHA